MDDYNIRHLPVQEKGKVVGIVSERELHHIIGRSAGLAAKESIKARDVMIGDPYVVAFHTPLRDVASGMAQRHIGSAIVMRRGKLAGIFTANDACRILSEYLDAFFPRSGDNAAA
jgi:acetoin utilization protein AcuB